MNDAVDSLLDRGLAHHRAGELSQAESLYRQVLEAMPTHPVALHLLGVLATRAGQNDAALEFVDRAIAAAPNFAAAYASRGHALYGLSRYPEAAEAYARSIALNPQHAEAYYSRGSALHALRRYADALVSYDQAIALKPDYIEAHVTRGNTLCGLARYQEALAGYDRALAVSPSLAVAWCGRSNALHALGDDLAALESADHAIALNPDSAGAHNNRGNALYSLCRYQEALASYDRAVAIDPSLTETWCNRSNALHALRDYLAALESADHAIALDPNNGKAHNNRGVALCELAQYHDAVQSFDRAIALKPGNDDASSNRGHALLQHGSVLDSEDMAPLLRTHFDAVLREVARIRSIPGKPERKAALDALPPEMQSHPAMSCFRSVNFIKTISTGHDLVFYCAPTDEIWNPRTARTKGIGGSEEAIIWLSRLLRQRGWNVTVYANCGALEREYDGVPWKPHWMWSIRDRQDVTVLWRHSHHLGQPLDSGKVIVDLHDVVEESEFSPSFLKTIDKISVKSRFHRSLFPNFPDEKFAVIPNGIDSTLFEGPVERDPLLLINTSSPDRSLEAFIDCFEQIKRHVPSARAQWAYGWHGWDNYPDLDPARRDWKALMQARMREVGVEELGRLSHSAIVGLYRRANVFAYPSEMAEIDCISLSKAMAAGAVPVTTDFAAMGDKAGHGGVFLHSTKTKDNWIQPEQFHSEITDPALRAQFVEETVRLLLDPPGEAAREPMRTWARATFDWERIADLWHEMLA
jgi:tetratricopeptide (TPR) repeat protein